MLKHTFDPQLTYKYVCYLRMSDESQNSRSPDQQFQEIERRRKVCGYPWQCQKSFRDDGIKGHYVRKRKAFQQMLTEIRSGLLQVDLILVDTLERFGRFEDLAKVRKELFDRHGVMILTADTDFCDPTTPQGKALGMVEAMRATDDGRIKAHNVLRGKRDVAMLRHWPGGPAPFGLMLSTKFKTVNGRSEVDYCLLVPNPATRWIIELLFELAERTSFGALRLGKALNSNRDIPDKYKPFLPSTIGYWLDSEIYVGDLRWAQNMTDIIDDTRVIRPNAPEDVLFVSKFCEPLVSRERWENVQRVRRVRRARFIAARNTRTGEKLIHAPAPGLTLRYPLSGLVFCECGLRMVVSSTKPYTRKDGQQCNYASYVCPGYLAGTCPNGARVPEQWVRSMVIGKLRERLFPESA